MIKAVAYIPAVISPSTVFSTTSAYTGFLDGTALAAHGSGWGVGGYWSHRQKGSQPASMIFGHHNIGHRDKQTEALNQPTSKCGGN